MCKQVKLSTSHNENSLRQNNENLDDHQLNELLQRTNELIEKYTQPLGKPFFHRSAS